MFEFCIFFVFNYFSYSCILWFFEEVLNNIFMCYCKIRSLDFLNVDIIGRNWKIFMLIVFWVLLNGVISLVY